MDQQDLLTGCLQGEDCPNRVMKLLPRRRQLSNDVIMESRWDERPGERDGNVSRDLQTVISWCLQKEGFAVCDKDSSVSSELFAKQNGRISSRMGIRITDKGYFKNFRKEFIQWKGFTACDEMIVVDFKSSELRPDPLLRTVILALINAL